MCGSFLKAELGGDVRDGYQKKKKKKKKNAPIVLGGKE